MLNVIRSTERKTETFASDIAFDVRTLGRDLVIKLSKGRAANPVKDGKQVNVVTNEGRKIRVVTRVLTKRNQLTECWQGAIHSSETAAINFSTEFDKPDSFVLVVFNPVIETVDVFEYPLEEVEGKKVAKPSYSVRYTGTLKGYNKARANLVASFRKG